MEPFCSTTVGSEIHYQCQTGFIPEQRTTLLCGEDGSWNPDPQSLCTGKELLCLSFHYCTSIFLDFVIPQSVFLDFIPVPENNLSTAAAIAITSVICLLVAFITGALCGALLIVCISRWNKKGRSSKPAPNTQEQQQAAVVYEEVDTQSKKIELKENVAYGPVKQDQTFELEENVAYGPAKLNK